MQTQALSPKAFATLLMVACLFGANHVAARVAINHGADVATCVTARSLATAVVVGLLVWLQGVSVAMQPRQRGVMAVIGVLVTVQSLWLYSAVARLPVGLALLAFNTYPLWTALWAFVFYRRVPERAVLIAMPVILVGLSLALDIAGATTSLGAQAQWARIGSGVGFALAASATFGVVLVLTQHEVAVLDGRLRTTLTMAIAGVLSLGGALATGGLHWPSGAAGWGGLVALSVFYGTAFTIVFTLLPKLGVVGNSPILNVEPVAALIMGWLVLDQAIAPIQIAGSLLVVGAVMALGLRRR